MATKSEETKYAQFHGNYPVRSLGHGEQGIHLPGGISGHFDIYSDDTGCFHLVPRQIEKRAF